MTAYTPNLPALFTALPGDHTRAPQTELDRARQVLFLENLSVTRSVRSAAAVLGVTRTSFSWARCQPVFASLRPQGRQGVNFVNFGGAVS